MLIRPQTKTPFLDARPGPATHVARIPAGSALADLVAFAADDGIVVAGGSAFELESGTLPSTLAVDWEVLAGFGGDGGCLWETAAVATGTTFLTGATLTREGAIFRVVYPGATRWLVRARASGSAYALRYTVHGAAVRGGAGGGGVLAGSVIG